MAEETSQNSATAADDMTTNDSESFVLVGGGETGVQLVNRSGTVTNGANGTGGRRAVVQVVRQEDQDTDDAEDEDEEDEEDEVADLLLDLPDDTDVRSLARSPSSPSLVC